MAGWVKENLKTLLVLLVIMGSAGFYVGITVADQPFFCGLLCHEMQPHVDSLKANFHGKHGVTCMDCHSEQGFFKHAEEHILASVLVVPHISKIYLEDEHNLHANVAGFNAEEMDFKHKSPAEQGKIFKECRVCHPNRLDGSYYMKAPASKSEMITENCKRCHEAIAGQKETDTAKAKAALAVEGAKTPRALPNVHPLHLGMDVFCNNCHSRIIHNNTPETSPMAMHDCTNCHNGETAPISECTSCHIGIKKIFEGNTGKGVPETVSNMKDIGCADCHTTPKTYKANLEACVGCHDESYRATAADLQAKFKEKFAKTTKTYKAVSEKLELVARQGNDSSAILSIFKDGEYNYKLAELDGSKGIHNLDYTSALLDSADHIFSEVNNMIEANKAH